MQNPPRHLEMPSKRWTAYFVPILCLALLLAVAVAAPQVLADAETCVRLLAFLIDVVRVSLG